MKNCQYPLIASGALLMLLASQPSQATPAPVPTTDSEFPVAPVDIESPDFSVDSRNFQPDMGEKSPSITNFASPSPLLAQTPDLNSNSPNSPVPLVQNPEIIIKSNGTDTPDILQPTTSSTPPLPRAVAPPVGDMAVSNIDAASSTIDLGTSKILPRLVLRQAPAREVLAVLARFAGLNLVFTDTPAAAGAAPGQAAAPVGEPTVSLDLQNEPVQDVFNSVLLISGLKANRRGKTIFVGTQLPQGARTLISRTIRLNQVKSFNAGTFLAAQGAEFQRLVTKTEDITDPLTGRVIGRRETPSQLEPIKATQANASTPLLLNGLSVTADDRLNSVTLIGEPRQVQVATSLLTQLDARRRQVAVNVKVVDINLINTQDFNSSFSFGVGDSFFVQDNGSAILRFGSSSPANSASITSGPGSVLNTPAILNPLSTANTFLNFNQSTNVPFSSVDLNGNQQDINLTIFGRQAGVSQNPTVSGITGITPPTAGTFQTINGVTTFVPGTIGSAVAALPTYFQYPQKFLALINTQIKSGNAKILTDPTLVVQEGQQATVKLTQKVIESVNTQVDPLSGVRTTTPVLADAGLTLVVNIDKIDDNGFITLSVSPTIASPGGTQRFDSGQGTTNTLTLLNRRELTSGIVRLRDGQTLILSGIIQETDQTTTTKVPLLGDIPILGALFRSESNTTNRTEVIIMLTPQIMNDNPQAQFGFNYNPGRDAAQILQKQGFPVQSQP